MLGTLIKKKYIQRELPKQIKSLLIILIMMGLSFLFEKKILARLRRKKNICINVHCYEKKLTFSIYISDQKFKNSIDLLLLADENKSHYVYIKNFDRLCFSKRRIKPENFFEKVVYSVLVVKMCCQSIKKFA